MVRNEYKSSVAEVFNSFILSQEENPTTGSLKLTQSNKRTFGKIFFRHGHVYAVMVNTYPSTLFNRIYYWDSLSDEHRQQFYERFIESPTDPKMISWLLTYQMIPEMPLTGFVKDAFLGAFDELITWENVQAEWKENDETNDYTVPFVEPRKLHELAIKRRNFLSEVAEKWGVDLEKIPSLTFKSISEIPDDITQTTYNILSRANGESSIQAVANEFGMSLFSVIHSSVYPSWEREVIELVYDNEYPIRHNSEEKAEPAETPNREEELIVPTPEATVPTYTPEPISHPVAKPSTFLQEEIDQEEEVEDDEIEVFFEESSTPEPEPETHYANSSEINSEAEKLLDSLLNQKPREEEIVVIQEAERESEDSATTVYESEDIKTAALMDEETATEIPSVSDLPEMAEAPDLTETQLDNLHPTARKLVEDLAIEKSLIEEQKELSIREEAQLKAGEEEINFRIAELSRLKEEHAKRAEELSSSILRYSKTVEFLKTIN